MTAANPKQISDLKGHRVAHDSRDAAEHSAGVIAGIYKRSISESACFSAVNATSLLPLP
jgi:hypothetical protein